MTTGPEPLYSPPVLSADEAADLSSRYGLRRVGRRPRLTTYVREVWHYRHLAWKLARGEVVSAHRDNFLGLIWSVLNPILIGIAYYLIFGLLFNLRRDVDNFISFLTIGLFTFTFISSVLTSGSKVLIGKQALMRSLDFPRVLLPLVVVVSSFVGNLPAFGVLVLIALVSGEPVTLSWLLFPVALLVVAVMMLGMAMILARVVHAVRDLANLIPVAVRLLRYASGVFFSIEARVAAIAGAPVWVGPAMELQPVAVSLTLVRETLMQEMPLDAMTWAVSCGWAVLFLAVGFFVFWRAEGSYGRA